jgi:hypothetical protein
LGTGPPSSFGAALWWGPQGAGEDPRTAGRALLARLFF